MKKSYLFLLILVFPFILPAQINPEWTKIYNGPDDYFDNGVAITLDPSGNVFVGGTTVSITNGAPDYAVIKYTSSGQPEWTYIYNGTGSYEDFLTALATDSQGNVYITGGSYEGSSRMDYVTIKLTNSGAFAWKSVYKGLNVDKDDIASGITIGDDDYVYVTGSSAGFSSSTWTDYATVKLSPGGGDTVWTRRLGASGMPNDRATAIAVDHYGCVYVTGYVESDVNQRYNYATVKYKPNGDTAWVRTYNGTGSDDDRAYSIAVDNERNVFITGASWGTFLDDYATIKYDSNGLQKWVAIYNGPANSYDKAWDLILDNLGNVYVTGQSGGAGGSYDYCTIKYNTDGGEEWVARYNGPDNLEDVATALAIDQDGDVFVTGYSKNAPSPYISTSDMVIIKYNSAGQEQWQHRFNGPGDNDDMGYSIISDPVGNVYASGTTAYYGQQNSSDIFTVKYTNPSSVEDLYFLNTFKIYPNPAENEITVELPENSESITISGLLGKPVLVESLKNISDDEYIVDISTWPSGVYLVKLFLEEGAVNVKLIVK